MIPRGTHGARGSTDAYTCGIHTWHTHMYVYASIAMVMLLMAYATEHGGYVWVSLVHVMRARSTVMSGSQGNVPAPPPPPPPWK